MAYDFRILPYKMVSQSSRVLSEALDGKRIKLEDSNYTFRDNHLIINWGYGQENMGWMTNRASENIVNPIMQVAIASHKLKSFDLFSMRGVSTVAMSRSVDIANNWLQEGNAVLGRDLFQGSGGRGITVYHPDEYSSIPNNTSHRYFSKYVKKRREFRIHVGYPNLDREYYPNVFFIQEKKRRAIENRNQDIYNPYIRNYSNEWIFAHNDLETIPNSVLSEAKKAVRALRLHFGAVDVIYNSHYDQAYVLEVNTACGMEGETLHKYTEYFNKFNQ